MSAVVRDELNVKELRFVSEADELVEVELKPNYRTLGPRFGKQMPLVAAAVAGLDAGHAVATLRDGGTLAITVGGKDHELTAEDLQTSMKPLEGYQVEREGSHAVALELEIDDELRVEGWAREIVRAVQLARQEAGLEVTDRIVLTLDGDDALLGAARAHQDYIAGETLAVEVGYEPLDDDLEPVTIDGRQLWIGVALRDSEPEFAPRPTGKLIRASGSAELASLIRASGSADQARAGSSSSTSLRFG